MDDKGPAAAGIFDLIYLAHVKPASRAPELRKAWEALDYKDGVYWVKIARSDFLSRDRSLRPIAGHLSK